MANVASVSPLMAQKSTAPAARAKASNAFDAMLSDSIDSKGAAAQLSPAPNVAPNPFMPSAQNYNGAMPRFVQAQSAATNPFALIGGHPFDANSGVPFQFAALPNGTLKTVDAHEPMVSSKLISKSGLKETEDEPLKRPLAANPVIVDVKPVSVPTLPIPSIPMSIKEDGSAKAPVGEPTENSAGVDEAPKGISKEIGGNKPAAIPQTGFKQASAQPDSPPAVFAPRRETKTPDAIHSKPSKTSSAPNTTAADSPASQEPALAEAAPISAASTPDASATENPTTIHTDVGTIPSKVDPATIQYSRSTHSDSEPVTLSDESTTIQYSAPAGSTSVPVVENVDTPAIPRSAPSIVSTTPNANAVVNAGFQSPTALPPEMISNDSPNDSSSVKIASGKAKATRVEKRADSRLPAVNAKTQSFASPAVLPSRARSIEVLPNEINRNVSSRAPQSHADSESKAVHVNAPAAAPQDAPKTGTAENATVATSEHEQGKTFPGSEQHAPDSGSSGSGDAKRDTNAQTVDAIQPQRMTPLDIGNDAKPAAVSSDVSTEHPVVQHVLEALPKPLQPGSVTVHSAEFGTIRILISQQPGSSDGSGMRIQIRVADPAARALLNSSVDSLRQKLQTESVHVVDVKAQAGDTKPSSPNYDRQERRRPAYAEPPKRTEKRTDDERAFWE